MNDRTEIDVLDADASLVSLLNKSEIEQQIATAHKFPRSIKQFRTDVMDMVTLHERIAQECVYALPRDGKVIEGPSARFAEVVLSAWGNSRCGARVVSDQGDFVTAQGVFHDLQKNSAITYEVQRRITNNKGKRYGADMIGVTANAACSIALRNAILKGVPKAYWAEMYEAARRTAMGDIKTLPNRRDEAFKQFQAFGVSKEQIFAKLGVLGKEDIGLEQLVMLGGILTAIKEGDTSAEQAFADEQSSAAVRTPKAKSEQTGSSVEGEGSATATADQPKSESAAPTQATAAGAATGTNEKLASEGEKKWLRSKLSALGIQLDVACEECKVENFDTLSVDEFVQMQDFVKALPK